MVPHLRSLLSLVAISIVVATCPAVASAQSTLLVVHSEPGDRIGGGVDSVVTPQMKTFALEKNYRGGVSVLVGSYLEPIRWRMEFAPPKGDGLTVGYYPGALAHPWAAMAAMLIDGPGGGCGELTGRFLVRELVFGANDEVLKFAVDAEQHCSGATAALFIALRYNSAVPTEMFPGDIGRFGISITPSADGVVSGGEIACGNGQAACTVVFDAQTVVTLTATPRPGYIFTGWTGACSGAATTVVNVNMVRDCRATFATAVPSTARTRLSLRFTPGDPLLSAGGEEIYSLENSRWTLEHWNDGLIFRVAGAGSQGIAERTVRLMAPPLMVLGQWYEVSSSFTPGLAGLDVSAGSSACGSIYGRIRIHEWRVSPLTGQFAVAADFEQRCASPTAPLLTGTIHYQATFEIPPPPPPPPACPPPDPFAALGGGTCHNGGWLPPGMTPPPVAPPPPATVLVFQSEPGDYIGDGISATYTAAGSQTFTVQRNYRGGISADIRTGDPSIWWTLHFAASTGVPLTPGYYPGALRYPFAPLAAMDISGSGRGCNQATGRFLVRELIYGADGEVVRLAVDAEQHCQDRNAALFAALRYNSAVPTDMFPGSIGRYGINITPSPHGLVTGDGISCGSTPTGCSVVFSGFTTATLTAIPHPGYIFTGWTGACSGAETTTVKVNTVRDCAATFDTVVPSTPRTRLVTTNPLAGSFGMSRNEVYSPLNSHWQPRLEGSSLVVDIGGADATEGATFRLRVVPPSGILNYGQWYDTTLSGEGGTAGLYVSSLSLECRPARERVRIHEWRLDPTLTSLQALALDFERYCGSETTPLLTGTLQYRATFEIQAACTTPDPFAQVGGGVCYNGGWLPPGPGAPPPSPPPPPPPSAGTCAGADPFAAIGGGACYNGGWLPPGMLPPGSAESAPPPVTPPPPPTPTSPTIPSTCATADPFAAIGGGTCFNGGWLPPGMAIPGGGAPPPTPPPPTPPPVNPPPPTGSCTTPDPFTSIGGGTCYAGGWLPPGMPVPGGGGGR